MKPYKNIHGHSGILSYETGEDYIDVCFADGDIYRYDYTSPGRDHVERMKSLAETGTGLNTYINKYIRKNYTSGTWNKGRKRFRKWRTKY